MIRGVKIVGFMTLGFLVLMSCTKEKVVIPESNEPVFTLNGTIAGESLELVAGDNGAYMYTSTENVNGVNLFSGTISDGNLSISMGIYDGMIDMPNHQPQSHISNITPEFARQSTSALAYLSKSMFSNVQSISEIDWYIDGNFVGSNNYSITQPGHYDVCAAIHYTDSSTDTLCNDMIVGYSKNGNFSIDFDSSTGYLDAGVSSIAGGAISSVNWFLDGVAIGSGNNIQSALSIGSQLLSCQVEYANGAVRTKNVIVNEYSDKNIEDFTMFEYTVPSVFHRDFNLNIAVEMNGEVFTSEEGDNYGSTIEILNVEYYDENSSGNDVYKVDVKVTAMLRSSISLKQVPVNLETTFGIEIPQ